MTDYKTRVKASSDSDWRECSTALIAISLGNDGTRGDKLASIVTFINANKNFQRCVVDLSDSLYAWNLTSVTGVDEDLRKEARLLGDAWLTENSDVLKGLNVPFEVIRWDHWLSDDEFTLLKIRFMEIEQFEPEFRRGIDQDIERFRQRRYPNGGEPPSFDHNCRDFILEEIAAHTMLHRRFGDAAKIYPGRTPDVFRVIKAGLVPSAPRGLETQRRVEIRIERAHGLTNEMRASPRPEKQPV